MIHCTKTNSENEDFRSLVTALDKDLAIRDGAEHAFYAQFNTIATIKNAIVAYDGDEPAGCGAIKEYDADTMEVKRMYVPPQKRGQGIASLILKELENWATELGYKKCLLETGKKQPEAIALYTKSGYVVIANYGQYEHVENSICFQKTIG